VPAGLSLLPRQQQRQGVRSRERHRHRELLTMKNIAFACALFGAGAAFADDAAFDKLVDAYYAEYPSVYPTSATRLGLHENDANLEDLSQAGIAKELKRLRGWRDRVAPLSPKDLSPGRQADLALLRASINARIVELDEVQTWKHRPDLYARVASASVYVIIKRDYAPAEARLRSVLSREAKIPALLAEAKKNLSGVARVAVEITIEQLPGIVGFFKKDVPAAFAKVNDVALQKELAASTEKVAAALEDYGAWLKSELLPKANAPFAIGEALFRKKLANEELVDAPLDEVLARGEAEMKRLQADFRATAAKIDPKRPPGEVLESLHADHEPADKLIAATQARLGELRKFLVDKQIVTIPSEVMPKVQETPPFMRATTMASMETPGPFETRATEAYYNVTLPDPRWPKEQAEDFLRGAFSRTLVDVVSIHEAFPGHYVQFLWLPKVKSKVRKFEGAASNSEGWAHYCEQMILDEGWGNGDPKLRLSQIQDALLRAARYVVGIRMHTRGMTFAEGVDYFQKEGFQTRKVSEMEVKRGTGNPTYLYYTLGKLEILKLRDAYKKKLGKAYTTRAFHDALLAEGALPLPLLKKLLIGE
jgi:uncharacterized protein (DUF885 family)